ncbi:50S ribosomal protein L34, partial [Dysosmobacter welbionis]
AAAGGSAAAGERMGRGEHRRHPHRPGPQGGPLPPGDGGEPLRSSWDG